MTSSTLSERLEISRRCLDAAEKAFDEARRRAMAAETMAELRHALFQVRAAAGVLLDALDRFSRDRIAARFGVV